MRRGRRRTGLALAGVLGALLVGVPTPAGSIAAAPPAATAPAPGAGRPFPRVAYAPGTEDQLRDRLEREPHRTLFLEAHQRAEGQDDRALGDHSIAAQRDLTRAAKWRAFEFALDRTVIGGAIVPFPSEAERLAAGRVAADVLEQLLPRSRLAVDPPIGGWDRDISSSEELISAAEAFDLLVAGGYPFDAAGREAATAPLAAATDELWTNYTDLTTANGFAALHQNNHRTKSGAAMATVALVLADDRPAAQTRRWFDTGAGLVDDVVRHVLVTGDGAYAEGPFYWRFTLLNLVPYLAGWEQALGAEAWTTAGGRVLPALAHHPLVARTVRWLGDLTLPDGSLAPIDDGNPGRSAPFGALPTSRPPLPGLAAEAAWRWAEAPDPYAVDGNVDLTVESIAAYDDGVSPAAPDRSPTSFYVEGGDAVLRTSWREQATEALVLGEHDTASEFGRGPDGLGRWPQSHEHADPGAFLLHAHGERLALDPGYLSFTEHGDVNQPEDHNLVLVDGHGPADYLQASVAWGDDPAGRPPAEGQSTITATLDGDAVDAATVVTAYRGATVARRFVLLSTPGADDGYLVVAEPDDAPAGADLTWMLHGNGGGTSGAPTSGEAGGTRTHGDARLTSDRVAVGRRGPRRAGGRARARPVGAGDAHRAGRHDRGRTSPRTVPRAPARCSSSTRTARPTAPTVTTRSDATGTTIELEDAAGDRSVQVLLAPDGRLRIEERHLDGRLRMAWAEGVDELAPSGGPPSPSATRRRRPRRGARPPPRLGIGQVLAPAHRTRRRAGAGRRRLGRGARRRVLGHARRWRRAPRGRGRRAAHPARRRRRAAGGRPGPDQRVEVGSSVALDGSASCDPDGTTTTMRWELASAPPAAPGGSTARAPPPHPARRSRRAFRVRLVATGASRRARSSWQAR
ncbi:MAG: heparinase II/III family protein [Acidimicrobiales bacterium]